MMTKPGDAHRRHAGRTRHGAKTFIELSKAAGFEACHMKCHELTAMYLGLSRTAGGVARAMLDHAKQLDDTAILYDEIHEGERAARESALDPPEERE